MSIFRRVIKKIRGTKPTHPCTLSVDGEASTEFPYGTTLLQAIKKMDVDINYYCGGTCSCGTCYVKVLWGAERLSDASGREQMVLGVDKYGSNHRLSCQARIQGDVTIKIPEW